MNPTLNGQRISGSSNFLRSCYNQFLKKQINNSNYKFTSNELKDIETIKSLLRERE